MQLARGPARNDLRLAAAALGRREQVADQQRAAWRQSALRGPAVGACDLRQRAAVNGGTRCKAGRSAAAQPLRHTTPPMTPSGPPRPLQAARRALRLPWRAGVCLALALLAAAVQAQALTHDEAVAAARAGRHDEAIMALKALDGPQAEPRVRDDLAVVLAWAGRDGEALAVFDSLPGGRVAPLYVRLEMAGAARRLGRLDRAEALARDGRQRDPAEAAWPALLARVLAEQGRHAEARQVIDARLAEAPRDVEARLASAEAHRLAADRFAAIRELQRALDIEPGRADAQAGLRALWQSLGAVTPAADALPGAVPLALRADAAAQALRRAIEIEPADPARRFDAVDAVLAQQQALLDEAEAARPPQPAVLRQLRRDRVVALHQRERWQDAVDAAAALRDAGDEMPPFVRLPEAGSLLALRRPAEAQAGYEAVLADPQIGREQRLAAMVGLFFALSDQGQSRAAIAAADRIAAFEGPWLAPLAGSTMPRANTDWLSGQVLAALARYYADMNADAWARLEALAAAAPAVAYLRNDLGTVAAARGWPRRADEEVHIAASLAPDDRGIAAAQAESALRRKRWLEAEARVAALALRYPQDANVRRLQQELRAWRGWELQLGFAQRLEDGSAAQAPGDGFDASARLYSPPLAERWRLLGAADAARAEPPEEGRVTRQRLGAGLEWRGPDATATLTGWANSGTVSRGGASFAADWQPADGWNLGFGAERFAAGTPLRALYYGITADAVQASARYDWHESAGVWASVGGMRFSDTNRRTSVLLAGHWRAVDAPTWKLALRPEYGASRNTLAGAPYFNPSQDRSALLDATVEQRLSLDYERSLWHYWGGALGSYWQQGYGASTIGSLHWRLRWRWDPFTEVNGGIEGSRRVYDGVPERVWTLSLALLQRF